MKYLIVVFFVCAETSDWEDLPLGGSIFVISKCSEYISDMSSVIFLLFVHIHSAYTIFWDDVSALAEMQANM